MSSPTQETNQRRHRSEEMGAVVFLTLPAWRKRGMGHGWWIPKERQGVDGWWITRERQGVNGWWMPKERQGVNGWWMAKERHGVDLKK